MRTLSHPETSGEFLDITARCFIELEVKTIKEWKKKFKVRKATNFQRKYQ